MIGLLLCLVMLGVGGGVLVAGILAPIAFGINTVKDAADDFYNDIKIDSYTNTLSSETVMYAADGTTELAKFFAQDRIVVPISNISDEMQEAIIAREDKRFYEHNGIDIMGTLCGLLKTSSGSQTQGGSTITQQYIKNLLIDNALQENDPISAFHAKEQTLMRKIKEAKFALEIEQKLTKEQILEGYLNVAPFGANVYGAESSALRYFSKHASDLTFPEAALIAGVTKSPVDYDPLKFPENAQRERNIVLGLLFDQGKISKEDYEKWVEIPIADMLNPQEVPVGCQVAGNAAVFCSYVEQVILNSNLYGRNKEERRHFLYQGGLKIYTTIDLKAQNAMNSMLTNFIPADDSSGFEDAGVTIEPGTGKVIAMAQNRPYNPGQNDPTAKDTAINLSVDKKYGGSNGFSPGSTIKLVAIVDWLKNGKSLNDASIAKVKVPFSSANGQFACADYFSNWKPKNAAGGQATSTPLAGFNQSLNIPMLQMIALDGMCSWSDTASKMGIVDEYYGDLAKSERLNASMVIGALNTTPINMANAFATIASGGIRCNPIAITKMETNDGIEKPVPKANCQRTFDEEVANAAFYALKTNVTQGIAKYGAVPGYEIGIKTGTSDNDNHMSAAMCVPKYCTYTWAGNAEYDVPFHNIKIGGVYKGYWTSVDVLRNFRPYYIDLLNVLNVPHDKIPSANPKYLVSVAAPKSDEDLKKEAEAAQNAQNSQTTTTPSTPSDTTTSTTPSAPSGN